MLDGRAAPHAHLQLLPAPHEIRAGRAQPGDQPVNARILRELRGGGAQVSDALLGERLIHRRPVPEQVPDDVAAARRPRRRVAEQRCGHPVPGEDLVLHVDDVRRRVVEPVEQVQDTGRHVRAGAVRRDGLFTGQAVQVGALVVEQPQRPGQRREHLPGRLRAARLLHPGVVVHRDPGQPGHLLTPQTGVRRRVPAASPTSPGCTRDRRSRRNSANWRRSMRSSSGSGAARTRDRQSVVQPVSPHRSSCGAGSAP